VKQFKVQDGTIPTKGRPQLTRRITEGSTTGPAEGPQGDPQAPRKAFTRNLTFNPGNRTMLVVGGLATDRDGDGRQPFIPAQQIAKRLQLDSRYCVLADPRELGKIEACRAMGLQEYGVVDLNRRASLAQAA